MARFPAGAVVVVVGFARSPGGCGGDGIEGDNFILAPPLIITAGQVGEMIAILADSLDALATELDLPVNR